MRASAKKRFFALAVSGAITTLGVAMATPASASSNPNYQAYHVYTSQPSNWTCGGTVTIDSVGIYGRTCIVLASDGASYQDVTIVNNTSGSARQINTTSASYVNNIEDTAYGFCLGFTNGTAQQPLAAHTAYYCPGHTFTAPHGASITGSGFSIVISGGQGTTSVGPVIR
ncbi:hypothetical protein ABIA31_000164 [Catenulispora sp. MAP5-51]|uniref:hypothetical protein n=1 Tax=Catenulispora sp. MAP5-51 TaxID=3156298 RepID=UPI00351747B0